MGRKHDPFVASEQHLMEVACTDLLVAWKISQDINFDWSGESVSLVSIDCYCMSCSASTKVNVDITYSL